MDSEVLALQFFRYEKKAIGDVRYSETRGDKALRVFHNILATFAVFSEEFLLHLLLSSEDTVEMLTSEAIYRQATCVLEEATYTAVPGLELRAQAPTGSWLFS